ncbi:alpha/beta fold hydrolase [Photobacterium atrarenae]|uniref:AB hydrolase-1 domain-containing protein n=1 Tax=Photobacterium atrarenae TaxID=865757 RepID=A0ABY5GIQ4_9GAMM|nr:alpha/beta fold hydrolase [Photobacterium atrarenae]UTV28452.1 hypothetical protein NNL38_04180 [Photobacterium atrarenae]
MSQTCYSLPWLRQGLFCTITVLLLSGCPSDGETEEAVAVEIPFSVNALPMPNDGYDYDHDGTISLPDEPEFSSADNRHTSYYQDFETSFAALDGWGLCTEPLEIPLQSIHSGQRYPLAADSLENNVLVIRSSDLKVIETKLSSDGSSIQIECQHALDTATTYHMIVTSGVKTQFGESVQPSSEFTQLLTENVDLLDENEQQIRNTINHAIDAYTQIGGDKNSVIYASTFTTQDSYAILDAIVENNSDAKLAFITSPQVVEEPPQNNTPVAQSGISDLFVKYELYRGSLTSNYYLPFSQKDADSGNCVLDKYDPITHCPDMYQWMTAEDGSHLTHNNPLPQSTQEKIPVDLYLPEGQSEGESLEKFQQGKLPVVIFIHGVTADKSAAALMMKDFVKNKAFGKEFAVIAIDMPYHGERIIYADDISDDSDELQPISAKANKSYFINISSPLTLRGNLHQAVSDFISLRYALNDYIETAPEVHLVGHSLGGIVSVMVSEMTQRKPEQLSLTTANFIVPGQGLVNITLESLTLGSEMEASVKSSPDIQRAIAETVIPNVCYDGVSNQECITALETFVEDPDNKAAVEMLADEIYQAILPHLKKGVQRTIDSADPVSKTSRQVEHDQPTLLIEAKGNCGQSCEMGEYMPDVVIPNATDNNTLTGTEPLIRALELEAIRDDQVGPERPLRGAIRATVGGHGTYLFPYEGPMDETGLPSTEQLGDVYSSTNTQQEAVYQMISSQGTQITFDEEDKQNIETEEDTEDTAQ